MLHKLWYRNWTDTFMEGLPLGNGRLALMAVGSPDRLRLAVNHEWLWRGENRFREVDDTSEHLPEVRELIVQGDFATASQLANTYWGGCGGRRRVKNRVDPYQPLGDLFISTDCGETSGYTRSLDLDTGLCTVEFDGRYGHTTEQIFVSAADGCAVINIQTERPAEWRFTLSRIGDEHCTITHEAEENRLRMNGRFDGGLAFADEIAVFTDGARSTDGDTMTVSAATETTVFLQASTDVKGCDPSAELVYPAERDFAWLFGRHAAAFARLKGDAALEIDVPDSGLPTDERIRLFREGGDPSMPLLYFEYARYLMVSGSSGELPLNLQGKWNEDLTPPWESDYHVNINLQMCYWFVDVLGMDKAADTMFNLIEGFVPYAKVLAKKMYGCRGIVICHQTDAWGRPTPEACGYAVWIGGAAWLGQHLFRHWRYTRDRDFLRDRCYPYLKEAAAFYEDYLVEHGGQLWIMPSQSPENHFEGSGDMPISIGLNSAMDIELANDTLTAAIECAEELGVDEERIPVWREMLDKLVKLSIDSTGRLNEWDCERKESEPGHRHVSHLYGLYPSEQFEPGSALWRAAEKSLDVRMSHGGGHTGWSRSWVACLMARLGRSEDAWEHLIHLIGDFATSSLLDLHPPRIFQIDGNMGGAACITEMLMQSRKGELRLLPALPKAWPNGSVRNFRAQDGLTVSFDWKNGQITSLTITADHPTTVCIIANGRRETRPFGKGLAKTFMDGVWMDKI